MGLLEDAIREHLELKRLRGADPAEVAREQHEALDAGPGAAPEAPSAGPASVGDRVDLAVPELDSAGHAAPDQGADPFETPSVGAPPQTGQETAELDMEAVLADHLLASDAALPAERESSEGAERPVAEENAFEWELPPGRSQDLDPDAGPHDVRDHEEQAADPSDHWPVQEPPHEPAREDSGPDSPGQGRLSL